MLFRYMLVAYILVSEAKTNACIISVIATEKIGDYYETT